MILGVRIRTAGCLPDSCKKSPDVIESVKKVKCAKI
jgi:hypothetical protein